MIEFKNVSFAYQGTKEKNSIHNLNFSVPKGQVVVLCGESGCGKTTLIRCINGLIPHYYKGQLMGNIEMNKKDIATTPLYEIAENTGSVFQNPRSQFFNVDTNSELSFSCENLGYPQEEIKTRVQHTVNDFNIESLLDKSLFHLSGGEKQIIACASISATSPDVILLDEPSSNLDTKYIDKLEEIINRWKFQGKTVIISEHRLYYLSGVADRFVCLKKGSIAFDLPTFEFLKLKEDNLRTLGLRTLNLKNLKEPCLTIKETEKLLFSNFTFAYKKRTANILNIKDLHLPTQEIIAVIGNNGCGKSTFARCICGLKKAGTITYNDNNYTYKNRLKACYMVMQDVNHQLFTESVAEEVLLSMQENDNEIAENILSSLDLLQYKEKHPQSLSGGEKQRVAIATAIASGKDFILFDEPTSGLDFRHMKEVSTCLKKLKEAGKTLFVITHDIELIYSCCTYILHIENGEVYDSYPLHQKDCKKVKDFFAKTK